MTISTLLSVTFSPCFKVDKTLVLSLVLNKIISEKKWGQWANIWLIGFTVLAAFFSFLFFFAKDSVLPALDKSFLLCLSRLTSISKFPDRRYSLPFERWNLHCRFHIYWFYALYAHVLKYPRLLWNTWKLLCSQQILPNAFSLKICWRVGFTRGE